MTISDKATIAVLLMIEILILALCIITFIFIVAKLIERRKRK